MVHVPSENGKFIEEQLPSLILPIVREPIPSGVRLTIPAALGDQELAKLGLVDVTAAPFHADPTGKRDSTKALRDAILFARNHQMVCFFPLGTYMVSDTLVLTAGITVKDHMRALSGTTYTPCLLGSRKGEGSPGYRRPTIYLKERSAGFSDPQNRKFVVRHESYNVDGKNINTGHVDKWGTHMYSSWVNIDITIGPGNPEAIGMQCYKAEGSVTQDLTVDATHGYAGIEGKTGNGASWVNIKVIGGRIGLDMQSDSWPKGPFVGSTQLINQTEKAIWYHGLGHLTAVGLKIVSNAKGPLIDVRLDRKDKDPYSNGITLIDSQIQFTSPSEENVAIHSPRDGVYLNNVFIENARAAIVSDKAVELAGNPTAWLQIKEFARSNSLRQLDATSGKTETFLAPIYLNGELQSNPLFVDQAMGQEPPSDLLSRHLWSGPFPSFESAGAVNARSAPYGAKGDSFTDDTNALQKAIDENDIVFLPKGYYSISKPLKLRARTKLVGINNQLSSLVVRNLESSPMFNNPEEPLPMVETADDAQANTVIAFLGIRPPTDVKNDYRGQILPVYALHWRCGSRSILQNVNLKNILMHGYAGNKDYKRIPAGDSFVRISGNGGGKWYGFTYDGSSETTANTRQLRIEGTTQPLSFYHFEPQKIKDPAVAMVETRNSKYISFYSVKCEGECIALWVRHCDHIRCFGHSGKGDNADAGSAFYVIENTPNVLIASQAGGTEMQETHPGKKKKANSFTTHHWSETSCMMHDEFRMPANQKPILYRFGHPRGEPD